MAVAGAVEMAAVVVAVSVALVVRRGRGTASTAEATTGGVMIEPAGIAVVARVDGPAGDPEGGTEVGTAGVVGLGSSLVGRGSAVGLASTTRRVGVSTRYS